MTSPRTAPMWSVVIPYYNEREFIHAPLESAMAQTGAGLRLILVDNRSNDGSEARCREVLGEAPGIEVIYLREDTPGQIHALSRGFAEAATPYVAFWDADTRYPPHYLAEAERLLSSGRHIAAQAIDVYCDPLSPQGERRRTRMHLTQLLLSKQGHTGSFGQCFRTEALLRAGGPQSPHWPYVLYDHELMQRIFKLGSGTGSRDLWCLPSPRRSANTHVRWSLFERLLYHGTPFALKDWFFYRFLGPRFERRRMGQENLRQRDW